MYLRRSTGAVARVLVAGRSGPAAPRDPHAGAATRQRPAAMLPTVAQSAALLQPSTVRLNRLVHTPGGAGMRGQPPRAFASFIGDPRLTAASSRRRSVQLAIACGRLAFADDCWSWSLRRRATRRVRSRAPSPEWRARFTILPPSECGAGLAVATGSRRRRREACTGPAQRGLHALPPVRYPAFWIPLLNP